MKRWALVAAMAGCSTPSVDASPAARAPTIELAEIAPDRWCVTHGAIDGTKIAVPTVRAFARSTSGDAARLDFTYRGATEHDRALKSGSDRHQLGLKLRAQDGCNVVYVMWRADKAKLDVSVKRNPGLRTHGACGTTGYTKVKPSASARVPGLADATHHVLRAEIVDDELVAWIDDHVVWRGHLPAAARELAGPAGFRSDNAALEVHAFSAVETHGDVPPCPHEATIDD